MMNNKICWNFVQSNYYRFTLLFYTITVVVFLSTIPFRPYSFSYVLKALPVVVLLAAVIFVLVHRHKWYLALGLFFSAGGDVLLDLQIAHSFILGLSSFLIAHVFYLLLFLRYRQRVHHLVAIAALFALLGITAAFVFVPHAAALAMPVAAYISVITAMGITAALTGNLLLMGGAALFLLSDAGIAWNKFIFPFLAAPYYVMITYYAAQVLIFSGGCQLLWVQDDVG